MPSAECKGKLASRQKRSSCGHESRIQGGTVVVHLCQGGRSMRGKGNRSVLYMFLVTKRRKSWACRGNPNPEQETIKGTHTQETPAYQHRPTTSVLYMTIVAQSCCCSMLASADPAHAISLQPCVSHHAPLPLQYLQLRHDTDCKNMPRGGQCVENPRAGVSLELLRQ